MITCKSPVAVLRAAHALGAELFGERSHAFIRKDFTLPQLFACLVFREHQKKSYRGIEDLFRNCSDLRDAIGLTGAPDHNMICRAFTHLVKPAKMQRALDLTVAAAEDKGPDIKGDAVKPAALDGTCFESHHVSRHFEKWQRQSAQQGRKRRGRRLKKCGKPAESGETATSGSNTMGSHQQACAGRPATSTAKPAASAAVAALRPDRLAGAGCSPFVRVTIAVPFLTVITLLHVALPIHGRGEPQFSEVRRGERLPVVFA